MAPDADSRTAELTAELTAALAAVRAASELCRGAQGRLLAGHTLTKGDASPVTIADFAAQAVVCAELTDRLGAIGMIGEEDSNDLRSPDAADLLDAVTGLVQTQRGDAVASSTVLDWISVGARPLARRIATGRSTRSTAPRASCAATSTRSRSGSSSTAR